MAQTRKPTSTLLDIVRFAERLNLAGKRERYNFVAALESRPLGSNDVKTLRRTRDLIASALEMLPDREEELLRADRLIAGYFPDEESKALKKKATRETKAKAQRANTASVRRSKR